MTIVFRIELKWSNEGEGLVHRRHDDTNHCLSFPFDYNSYSSENGSPLDPTEQGALVATVQKKVRGRTTASFDINVGEGQYLSLDEHQIPHMDDETKNHAINQVKVLQDQLATLMQQLEN